MRCFIALALPDNVRREVTSVQFRLKLSGADVTWVDPSCLHVTIQFLGDIDRDLLPALKEALARVARACTPFDVSLGSSGAFPSLEAPRVIWQGIDDRHMRVGALIRACAHAMERFGIKREEHPIHPHITLGRVRSQRNYTLLKKEIEEGMKTRPSETTAFTVDTLTLYQSDLTPQGPRYTSLYSAIFAMT